MNAAVRQGEDHAALDAALTALAGLFGQAGYDPVTVAQLFAAETLIDVYGEDIRGRAFLFPGTGGGGAAGAGELCLRPDFTVPVVLAHGAGGWDRAARYAYQGPVFRRQAPGSTRPLEYLQAGIENLGAADPAAADAEVFALTLNGLRMLGQENLTISTGDLGIAFALLDVLPMPAQRRRRLLRHFWRPARFHALVEEAVAGPAAPSPTRARLIEAVAGPDLGASVAALAARAGEAIGLREIDEIVERARTLAAEADEPPMPAEQAELIEAALSIKGPSGNALARMRALTDAAGVDIAPALDRFELRLAALERAGIDAEALPFDAAFGRKLEYYEGFVFEIAADTAAGGRDDLPPLAGGGRYDAMTRRLGAAAAIPAVGAMIRPEAVIAARECATQEGRS